MRTFVLGDVHGGAKALQQVLDRANFDYENDKLISIGDVADGWPETPEAIEILLKIKNLVYCLGNHDEWALSGLSNEPGFFSFSGGSRAWLPQGGQATFDSYERMPHLREKHIEFLRNAKKYYIDDQNRLFLHAGFHPHRDIDDQDDWVYTWDRGFWQYSYDGRNLLKDTPFTEVYIGHTPTINYPSNKHDCKKPITRMGVTNVDTGAAYTGPLSLLDIDTKELFQSDDVMTLYPDHPGRNGKTFN